MQIKKLEFRDFTTDLGKEKGFIYLKSESLLHSCIISNHRLGDKIPQNEFYVSFDYEESTFSDLNSAIEFCQKEFENKIIDLFFEKKKFKEPIITIIWFDFWFQSLKKDFIDLFRKPFKEHFRLWKNY